MASVRTVHRLPAISRNGFVTTGGTNPLTRLGGGGGGRANAGEVTAVVDAGGGRGGGGGGVTGDRRTLLGVGTYLIDTPKDTGLQLRQRYFSFQEQHRGQVVKSQDEELPEIPFRLKPETAFTAHSTTGPPPSVLMVDVATSPIFFYDDDDESVFGPSRSNSPSQGVSGEKDSKVTSDAKDSNDVTDVTDKNAYDVINDVKVKTVSLVVKTSQGTSMGSMAHSVSFSERPRRKTPPRRPIRECSKVNPYSREGTTTFPTTASAHNTNTGRGAVNRETDHVAQRLPTLPDTARTNPTLDSFRRKSASVSDLTDIGSIFSWHDRDFELKTSRTVDVDSDNVGPTSYFQRSKSKSLLDLLRPSRRGGGGGGGGVEENADDEVKALDLSAAYHKRLRIAHLAFRRENTLKHTNSLSKSGDNDKEWMDMVNTQVVDNDYDRYASRRKPVTPFAAKKPSKPFSPRSGTDFRLTHPPNGKMYPVFTTDGAPPRKFGKALYKRKGSKASSK